MISIVSHNNDRNFINKTINKTVYLLQKLKMDFSRQEISAESVIPESLEDSSRSGVLRFLSLKRIYWAI